MNQRQKHIEDAMTAYKIAGWYRALGMRTGFIEYAELSKLYVSLAWRYERYADELTVKEQVPIIREEKPNMHPISRLITVFLVLMLLLSISVVSAQESTESPTLDVTDGPTVDVTPAPGQSPVETPRFDWEVVMPYVTQIVIAAITGFVALAGAAIVIAGRGMPPWGRAILKGMTDSGFQYAELEVAKTEQAWDDELLHDLKQKVDAIFEQMNESAPPPTESPQPGIVG